MQIVHFRKNNKNLLVILSCVFSNVSKSCCSIRNLVQICLSVFNFYVELGGCISNKDISLAYNKKILECMIELRSVLNIASIFGHCTIPSEILPTKNSWVISTETFFIVIPLMININKINRNNFYLSWNWIIYNLYNF